MNALRAEAAMVVDRFDQLEARDRPGVAAALLDFIAKTDLDDLADQALLPAQVPELPQCSRLVVVADDDELATVGVFQPDGDHASRQGIERGALEKFATMVCFGLGDFRRDLVRILQVSRFDLARIERRHERRQLIFRQRPRFNVEVDCLHGRFSS